MSKRFLNLDALRGLAAILVVWQHSSEIFIRTPSIAQHGTSLAEIISQLDFGRIGVICFFLISGFVIPYSFSGARSSLKTFAIRRFFRLYPAYWISLFIAVALAWLIADRVFPTTTVAANITMLQSLMGFDNVQGLYWTLTAELIFYCLCSFLFARSLLASPQTLLLFCWGGLSLFIGWQLLGKLPVSLPELPPTITYIPYCIAVMFCGTLIRHCHIENKDYWYATLALAPTFFIPLLVLGLHFLGMSVTEDPIRFGLSHLIALLIFFLALSSTFNPWRPLITLGTISYSIYLLHPVVIRLLKWTVQQPWGQVFSSFTLEVYLLATTLGSIALAAIVYRLIEKPSINLGRRLSRKHSRNIVATA
ncbi:acyltransferase [Microbulbifer sp. OS29]|uniref:Acyltransferase n=1 Tax=Microbulbifer okhotskensis TaxID=2926617 RepID=A0A9X2J6U4_9GAMM|nr:acyltransferase [Microbulbifer okhotskensis]MCO1335789.1 acyltransferase [Microbulbifer okhotskensis]